MEIDAEHCLLCQESFRERCNEGYKWNDCEKQKLKDAIRYINDGNLFKS